MSAGQTALKSRPAPAVDVERIRADFPILKLRPGGKLYLLTAGGKVNLNTADAAALDTLPRVGPAMAERIIAWREANGSFTAIEDLMNVTGIGDKTFAEVVLEVDELLFEGEAKRLIEAQCVLPAYEMVLKCSHAFNLLDARGAISVTERAAYIGRVRALAREVAQAYYDSRERLGFPMCQKAEAL